MVGEGKRKYQEPPVEPTGPQPAITPHMVRETAKVLEAEGTLLYSEGGVYVPTERGWKLLMNVGSSREKISAFGSENIRATSKNSFAIIMAKEIKTDADSVVAVRADKSAASLNAEFKRALQEGKQK